MGRRLRPIKFDTRIKFSTAHEFGKLCCAGTAGARHMSSASSAMLAQQGHGTWVRQTLPCWHGTWVRQALPCWHSSGTARVRQTLPCWHSMSSASSAVLAQPWHGMVSNVPQLCRSQCIHYDNVFLGFLTDNHCTKCFIHISATSARHLKSLLCYYSTRVEPNLIEFGTAVARRLKWA